MVRSDMLITDMRTNAITIMLRMLIMTLVLMLNVYDSD